MSHTCLTKLSPRLTRPHISFTQDSSRLHTPQTGITEVSHRLTQTLFCPTQASHKPHTPHRGHTHALSYTDFRQTSHRPHIGSSQAPYIPTKLQKGHTQASIGLTQAPHRGYNPHTWFTQTHKGLIQLLHKPQTGPTELSHKSIPVPYKPQQVSHISVKGLKRFSTESHRFHVGFIEFS